MDYLEQPEVKETYNKCKYIVKLWEKKFQKTHKRLPSKLDIHEADKNVRDAYRKYFQLKTLALEQSFKDVEGFNSDDEEEPKKQPVVEQQAIAETPVPTTEIDNATWGPHLDNQPEEPKASDSKQNKTHVNSSFAQKLFCGSKFSKRNPRKSLSFSQRKNSNVEIDSPKFCSQPLTQEQSTPLSFEGIFNNSTVKIVNVTEQVCSQPTNIIQSVLDNNYKKLKPVDQGWLKRVQLGSCINLDSSNKENDDYSSDDIIDKSDEEDTSFALGHINKKPKLSNSCTETANSEPACSDNANLPNTDTDIISNVLGSSEIQINFPQHEMVMDSDKELDSTETNANKNKRMRTKKIKKAKKAIKKDTPINHSRRSSRTNKMRKSMAESASENEDPYRSDNDSNDPEFQLDTSKKHKLLQPDSPEPHTTTTKTRKSKQPLELDETSTTYELEYSIKPRVSAPRFKNIKKLIKIETSAAPEIPSKPTDKETQPKKILSKRQQEKEKFNKKIETGTLNDNFVTINLKKKIYVRGKKNVNFSRFKKQQWKNKKKALAGPDMDMGGCDGGMLTCFNCGQTGHFARKCPQTKGDDLLPLGAGDAEEESAIPTLEEAAQMAKDSVLAIRKPNRGQTEEASDNELKKGDPEEENSDDDDLFDDLDTEKLLAETLRLEEEVTKLDLKMYMDSTKIVAPYHELQENGGIIDTPNEVYTALEKFGHSSFRPGQERAIMRILSGKSTLVTLSTGSGKSLCYQLPAYLYAQREPCISLVISPLVSLMEDQVTGIPSFLKAACLHTNQTKTQREKVLEAISSGNLHVLLVSPEAVVAGERSSSFGSLLRKLPPIAFACIDEAHCVSQWSHNFRPSYLMICRVLREKMGVSTVLGLTATATRATADGIIAHLQIPDGRDGVISDVPLPDNLNLSVSKDYQRDQALLKLLESERFAGCRSIIIYCTRREVCDRLAAFLRTGLQDVRIKDSTGEGSKKRKRVDVQAEPYHAGLSASRRRTIQNAFMSGELRIVIATVAFGMGINKTDIRAVIHYNMPKSFESYVQEIGRSGRDGLPAHCHLFLDAKGNDENELRRHIHANSIDRHVIRKLLQRIFLPCSCKTVCPKHEVAFSIEDTVRALDIPEENISTLLCYLELHKKKYIELLSPAYTRCKVVSYGGSNQIKKAAKECPPLAMALALQKNKTERDQNLVEFAVVDIAAAIGWDSGICKHKLKNLEWTTVNNQPKRSLLSVQFSDLGFRMLSPGNLSDDELDEALDSLYDHVVKQEETSLLQLRAVHQVLLDVAFPTFQSCLSPESTEESKKLKVKLREYFESPDPLGAIKIDQNPVVDEELVARSIRGLISTYRDTSFTGRAVARILHGISSPNYPAVIWGRCKYWRIHLNIDFHSICKIATAEILNFR